MPGQSFPFDAPPPDPASIADALATQFFQASDVVDNFRLSFTPPLPTAEDQRLRAESDALATRAQFLTAAAIGATLARVQPDLGRIEQATQQATSKLARLATADRVIQLATLLLSLGTSLSAGDPATILAATQGLLASL